jgi:predicted HAD superfamily Cof-like phosphohydrolase
MSTSYQNVKQFMTVMEQEVPSKVCDPGFAVRHLRAKLILEEALETVRALGFGPLFNNMEVEMKDLELVELYEFNFEEVFDGLLDLDYVGLQGTSIALGLSEEQTAKGIEEVHKSNMSKLWTLDELQIDFNGVFGSFQLNETKQIDNFNIKFLGLQSAFKDKCYLVKDSHGKVIKSPSFTPPNLFAIYETL